MSMIPDLDTIFKQYGDWWCEQRGGKCDCMNLVQEGYEKYRLTLSDMHIEYYDEPDVAIIPEVGADTILSNSTSVEQSQTVLLSKITTNSFAWTLQEGFKIGMSVKFSVGVPVIGSMDTTITAELSFSNTQTKTATEQRQWSVNQPVRVPSHTEVEAKLLIDEEKFSQRFHSKCVLGGYVCSNSPDRINGHYFWFHSVSDIFNQFPQQGFAVQGPVVLYQGDGHFEGLMGVRTMLNLVERPIGDKTTVLRSYNIAEALSGAGIAGIHDASK